MPSAHQIHSAHDGWQTRREDIGAVVQRCQDALRDLAYAAKLHTAKANVDSWEGRLAEIGNQEELERWLQTQPREVALVLAARAALRALPVVETVEVGDYDRGIVLPVFRAVAVSWSAARYPAQEAEPASLAIAARDASYTRYGGPASKAYESARAAVYVVFAAAQTDYFAAAIDAATFSAESVTIPAVAREFSRAPFMTFAEAALSAAESDARVFWSAISRDATGIEEGAAVSEIADRLLWPRGQPADVRSLWLQLRERLLAAEQDWVVWTLWYEDRLEGHSRGEAHELAYARIRNELWDQGPVVINAEVRRRLEEIDALPRSLGTLAAEEESDSAEFKAEIVRQSEEHELPRLLSQIPLPRPAALEPIWDNGTLVLPSTSATTDGGTDMLSAALKVLRAELSELAQDVATEPGNFDKRAVIYLRRIEDRIPERLPLQYEVFRLAHAKEFFESYAKTVDDAWPEHLAVRFQTLILHFDRVVRQFPEWRAFIRNAQKDRLTVEQITETPVIAAAVVEDISSDEAREFIDPAIPEALGSLIDQLQRGDKVEERKFDPIEAGSALLADDILESINNVFKAIGERLLASLNLVGSTASEMAVGYGGEARKSLIGEAKRLGKGTGPAFTKWAKRILFGGSTIVAGKAVVPSLARLLIHAFPDKFGWLEPFIGFFP